MPRRFLGIAEILLIIVLASVPLFTSFPYRVNIFLSWEGAYRISEGQLPFRDFGVPLGGMYWAIPALFFKIFGAQMITLVKAQVFINIISGLAFRSILKSLGVSKGICFVSVLLFCISYSFFNFWPWYNHTVMVYEFVAIAFLMKYIMVPSARFNAGWMILSALFVCFSFLTKQDGGGLAFLICCALLLYHSIVEKKWWPLPVFIGCFSAFLLLIIIPFFKYDFSYWFNVGQAPHSARFSAFEIIDEFFGTSQWLKFYIFLIVLILVARVKTWNEIWKNKPLMIFLLLTFGILAEAAIFQVTSYTPPDNNIFFHSFAIACILTLFSQIWPVNFDRLRMVILCSAGILLWWSGVYWKYVQRIAERAMPPAGETVSSSGENMITRKTFMITQDTLDIPMSQWIFSGLKSFDRIYMPEPTVQGIHRLLKMDIVKQKKDLKVLNMSELTPLAAEMPYATETGPGYPLWNHLGVGMFNKQAEMFEQRIKSNYYDIVLFEYIPTLNNFFPFRVRDILLTHYTRVDSFFAPRRGDTKGTIEVYVKTTDSLSRRNPN